MKMLRLRILHIISYFASKQSSVPSLHILSNKIITFFSEQDEVFTLRVHTIKEFYWENLDNITNLDIHTPIS